MSDRGKNANWVIWVALLPAWMTPILVVTLRDHGAGFREIVRTQHVALEQIMLGFAFVSLAAAVVAGVVTWRGEKRRHA